jgi:hypothetical protein
MTQQERAAGVRTFVASWFLAIVFSVLPAAGAFSQPAPFLNYNFDDGDLGDFFNPFGLAAISLCTDGIIPSGQATANAGGVLLTNDNFLGITLFTLHPDIVDGSFPAGSRDYKLRVKVNLETVNEISVSLRARIGVNETATQADSLYERGYQFALFPAGIDPELLDGVLGLGEFTACHELVDHFEWPGGASVGFARVDPGVTIVPGSEYWLEVSAEGNDEGGPVVLTARVWLDGDDRPECAQLTVEDPNGLDHTPETLDPSRDVQVAFGVSFDLAQQPGATARLDDLSLTQLAGCVDPPLKATRTLWNERAFAEGRNVALYDDGGNYQVSLALTDLRAAGDCAAPTAARICETLPAGWNATAISDGGIFDGKRITWNLNLAGGAPPSLTYTADATAGGLVGFQGSVQEEGSDRVFSVLGEISAAPSIFVAPISDFGSIQEWLILGPFTREVGGANPGDTEIVRDYLTDGAVTQETVRPEPGDQLTPDYGGPAGGAAASTGLAPDAYGRNPGAVPTWVEWRDFDDVDDRIDFETVYGALNEVMCHALTYLNVEDDMVVNFGISSDDAVQVLLDGVELHKNNVARGAEGRAYQDTPLTHPGLGNVELRAGQHVLLVKIFEGGGEHNFRVGFVDEFGVEIPGGPVGIEISFVPEDLPEPTFRRGDSDASGGLNITDGIFTLNFLFTGGEDPPCPDSADADDAGGLNITDGIRVLNHLFTGGPPPPAPGPGACGIDPTPDGLGPCVYTRCP